MKLYIATTPKEIIKVYKAGPYSCMSGTGFHKGYRPKWSQTNHPADFYGRCPNAAVAYATIGIKERIVARTVLIKHKNKWYSSYIYCYDDTFMSPFYKLLHLAEIKTRRNYYRFEETIVFPKLFNRSYWYTAPSFDFSKPEYMIFNRK